MNFKVPILNATSVKYIQPNTLVRFRGMIQDMLGNEFYAGVYKVLFLVIVNRDCEKCLKSGIISKNKPIFLTKCKL